MQILAIVTWFSDRELLSPADHDCSAEQTVTLVTSTTFFDVVSQSSSSSSASSATSDVGDLLKTVATSTELELVVDALTDEDKHHTVTALFRPSN